MPEDIHLQAFLIPTCYETILYSNRGVVLFIAGV